MAETTDFIYLTIPTEYVVVYKRLMQCLLDSGINVLKQCDCNCKNNKTRIIFDCWCAFQSAIAAKKLGMEKEADLIIKYILAQLDLNCSPDEVCDCNILPIDVTKGILEVQTNCDKCDIPSFYIDVDTGELYSDYTGVSSSTEFEVINNELTQI